MEGKEHEEYVKQQLIAALFKFRFDSAVLPLAGNLLGSAFPKLDPA